MAAVVEVPMPSMPESIPQENDNSSELTKIIWNYYLNGTHTDVIFHIKCGDSFVDQKAHKIVLAIWSPVFADMFYGPNAIQQDTVVITEVTPQVFIAMLKFAYGSVCDLAKLRKDVSFQLKIFRASQIYQIEYLESICRTNIGTIRPDKNNVFQLLNASRMVGAENKESECLELLRTNTEEILANQDLSDVTQDMMMTLLDLDKVSFSSEFNLVMWMFAWAKNEQVKPDNKRDFRSILNDVLGHVDLTAMTAVDFGKLLKNHDGVFSESECYKIFRNIVDPQSCKLPEWAKVISRVYSYNG